MARVVVPGVPHHVTQRGRGEQKTFFGEADYVAYLDLLAEQAGRAGTQVWAYCLMPNHVHLIMVPRDADGLRRALAETHRLYARRLHLRRRRTGPLWHERFHSFPLDEEWLLLAARHIELNPVRAGIVRRPREWPWSSAKAHLDARGDGVVKAEALLRRVENWSEFLREHINEDALDRLRGHVRTGRPLGSPAFVARLEKRLGRTLAPQRRGRKPRAKRSVRRRDGAPRRPARVRG
jgi:putative transposase